MSIKERIYEIFPGVKLLKGEKIFSPINPKGYYIFDCNTIIVETKDGNFVDMIDPGFYRRNDPLFEEKREFFESMKVRNIYLTHRHFDHFAIMNVLNYSGKVFAYSITDEELQYHPGFTTGHINFFDVMKTYFDIDPALLRHYQAEFIGEGEVEIGRYTFQVIHTPGHTPDSITFYQKDLKLAVVGDLIVAFQRKNGERLIKAGTLRPQGSNCFDLFRSLEKIKDLPIDILVPGHGIPYLEKEAVRKMKEDFPLMFYKVVYEYLYARSQGERFKVDKKN